MTLINKIISTYGQKEASIVTTPMVFGAQLLKPDLQIKLDENKCEQLATLPFCSLIGSLMYPATETRSDIMFTVSKLSHFLGCYCEAHQQAAIWVECYLKGTLEMTLELGGSSSTPTLIGYCNSDYANDPGTEGRKSVAGYCFILGSGIVSWSSKK